MGESPRLFDPERVAIVGATERDGSVGAAITENLIESFDGEVSPVNPNTETVFDLETVDSVTEPTQIDVAVLVVPPDAVLNVLEEAGESGIQNVVVITAGFSEAGSAGAKRERRLTDIAAEYDLNVVGPNSLGIMSTPRGLNATFGPDNALPGGLWDEQAQNLAL